MGVRVRLYQHMYINNELASQGTHIVYVDKPQRANGQIFWPRSKYIHLNVFVSTHPLLLNGSGL
jgi:hypothetical protein